MHKFFITLVLVLLAAYANAQIVVDPLNNDPAPGGGGGSGSSAALDLGDDASNESTGILEIATTGDTNSVFTEPSADKMLINLGNNWPTCDAATALATNPTDCSANQYATTIDASGNLTCSAITDADVPNDITIDAATALATNPTDCGANQYATTIDASGNLTCSAITDADVPDTITTSNYLPLSGGTMTGAVTVDDSTGDSPKITFLPETGTQFDVFVEDTDNDLRVEANTTGLEEIDLWNVGTGGATLNVETDITVGDDIDVGDRLGGGYLELTDDDTDPFCNAGEYKLFADLSETHWKACNNGTKTIVALGTEIATLVSFNPKQGQPPASNFATNDLRNSHPVLDFDDTTNEDTVFSFVMPQNYTSGGVTVYIHYAMTSATTGDIDWDVAFERIGDQQQDLDTDSFATALSLDNTTVPATSGNVDVISISFTDGAQMDSCSAGEACRIKLTRDATSDTATGDAELVALEIRNQ